ncbi:MAG: MerC domain-containing protein [Armatimonas sp.]
MKNWWDMVGAAGSTATGFASMTCAIHCAATPLLASALPLAIPHLHLPEPITQGLIVASLTLATLSLLHGYRKHQIRWPLWLLAGGAASFGLGELFHNLWLSMSGGLFLAGAHLWNWKISRKIH